MNRKRSGARGAGIYFLIFAVVLVIAWFYQDAAITSQKTVNNIEFSELVSYLEDEQVRTIKITESARRYEGELRSGSLFIAYAPTVYDMETVSRTYIIPQSGNGLTVQSVKPSSAGMWLSWLPTLLLIGVMIFFWSNVMGAGGAGGVGNKNVMNFGKSRAHMHKDGDMKKITFADVAGLDEEKAELEEIVDFLRSPKKYIQLGARIPKGVLLVGPPGTGKTYIAKAVAGEAGVPFFSISGSDFVEMFVGVGASRVRDLFADAKKNSPCIVFIDEIDAVGRRRGAGIGGGNDEREQTLNQLLTEMDGFDSRKGVVLLAATNRPESLDPALLRPGRFDRRIPVELPDLAGRIAILKVHARKVAMSPQVDLEAIARSTAGASGADLANIINEAALRAVRQGRNRVEQEDLEESVEVVIAGYQKKNAAISPKEKEIIAYHEIGHALVAAKQTNSAPVHKITIIPRTSGALGYTMQVEEDDRYLLTKEEAFARLATLTGGRAAEELVFNTATTGAANDIEQATRLARSMVTRYGMSDQFGMVALEQVTNPYLGGDTMLSCSSETAAEVDRAVMGLINKAHERAISILKDNMDKVHELARHLLAKETITGEEFMQILNA